MDRRRPQGRAAAARRAADLDGGADPPLQARHRGLPGPAGRDLLPDRGPARRARLLRARRRLREAGEGPLPRPVVRQPADAARHVGRGLHRGPDPEPRDAGPDPRRRRSVSYDEFRQPEHLMRSTDDLTAGERRRLIASMRPGDAEGVPELHEVDVPVELREEIETAMSRYPQLRSAAIPVLWAVQRQYGWCRPEGIRQAAAVMGVTPAYLEAVATFYDLFATSPIGHHRVL